MVVGKLREGRRGTREHDRGGEEIRKYMRVYETIDEEGYDWYESYELGYRIVTV